MMQLKWTLQAIREREAIVDYIGQANEIAALELDERIEDCVERLSIFPQSGRNGRVEGTRELVILGTPYLVAYALQENTIVVLTIRHGSRIWPTRI
jgi:toxin ParE1/3/4